jgi:hypothetical protein
VLNSYLQEGKFWQAVKQSSFAKMFSSVCKIFPLHLPKNK